MRIVGLTGPTGAGKTTVLSALSELDLAVVDCDRLYHRLLDSSPQLLEELTDRFGKSILNSQGKIDRKALGELVFPDPRAMADLNAVTHRHVTDACRALAREAESQGRRAIVFDAAALLGSPLESLCDVTVAVTAPPEERLRRVMARDGLEEAPARRRMAAQQPDAYYRARCDYAITNDGSKSPGQLAGEVRALFSEILC